jgi:hypothetical protein
MKYVLLLSLFLLSTSVKESFCQTTEGHRGNKPQTSFAELQRQFMQPDRMYAPFTFWFWDTPLDDPQTRQRLLTMAQTMMEQNLNPGYAHARMCMTGMPDLPPEQWLSGYWFDTFGPILDAAEKSDYYFAYCDEYWWPTGRAAGRVLANNPDLWSVSLYWHTFDLEAGETITLPESFFIVAARLSDAVDLNQLKQMRLQMQALAERDSLEVLPHLPEKIKSTTLQLIGGGQPFTWQAPGNGNWRVYLFKKYYHPGADGGRLNYLNPRLGQEFIKYAHQPYLDQFGSPLGKRIPGVFSDHEGDYGYKLAWSEHLKDAYKVKYGVELASQLPLLIDPDMEGVYAKVRWQWFDTVSDIYSGFFNSTNRWLEAQGMYCISNLWEENLMWQAGAVGDFFKIQRVFTMPGTDCLGLSILNIHDFKETQSVCEFEGRRMQSEIMGAAGWPSFTPITIKQAANAAICWGISHIVPHSIFSTRKLAGNPWIPDWYIENPMWPYLHLWTTFVQRASYVNSHGYAAADVLLLNPMDSVWELCGPGVFDPAFKGRVPGPAIQPLPNAADINQPLDKLKENSAWWKPPIMEQWFDERVGQINRVYSQAMTDLTAGRIEYLIADRCYMNQMQVNGKCLMKDSFEFKTIVLPPMTMLPLEVAEKIIAFADAGGYVYYLGSLPKGSCENGMNDEKMIVLMERLKQLSNVNSCPEGLQSLIKQEAPGLQSHIQFESGAFPMLQQHRRIDSCDFFWLANNTNEKFYSTLVIPDVIGTTSIWDCESGNIFSIPSEEVNSGIQMSLTFEPFQAFWLVIRPDGEYIPIEKYEDTNIKELLRLDGEWQVTIDTTNQPEMEFPYHVQDQYLTEKGVLHPLEFWDVWGLQKFSGYVDYTKEFKLIKSKGKILLELGTVWHMAQVWVNGQEVGRRLWPPYRFDITKSVKKGENRIQVRIGNLISNSYGQPKESGLLGPVSIFQKDSR